MRLQSMSVAIIVGFILPAALHAQAERKITGQVLDGAGKPVVGADVAVSWGADTGKMQPFSGVQTDKEGKYSLPSQVAPGTAVMVLDKERKLGRVAFLKESLTLDFQLEPLVKVHGSFFCKELNGLPAWMFVSINIDQSPHHSRIVQFSPKAKEFALLLPPGTYRLVADGNGVETLTKTITLSEETPDLDLKVLTMEATVITQHIGKAPPPWNVTAARRAKKEILLSDFKGKWVLLVFWSSAHRTFNNCELANLIDLYENRDKFEIIAFHDPAISDFETLDVKLNESKEWYWRGRDLPFPVLLDSTGQTLKNLGIRGLLPMSILIDPQGNVVGPSNQKQRTWASPGCASTLETKLPELPLKIRVANALDKRFGIYFDDPSLEEAVKTLSDMAEIPIRIDNEKLKAEGLGGNIKMPIRFNLGVASLRSALNLLLDGWELEYQQDDRGLVIRPRGARKSSTLSEHQRACAKRLDKVLDKKLTFDLRNQPLSDVAWYLGSETQENFVLEPADRRLGLIDPNTRVTVSAQQVPIREALEALLRPLDMGFVIRDEAVVLTCSARKK